MEKGACGGVRFISNIGKGRQEFFRIHVLDKDQIEAKFYKNIAVIVKFIQILNLRRVIHID